eukprot:scaffold127347_cov30-Prasinocladus_malaysianus.AAC.1
MRPDGFSLQTAAELLRVPYGRATRALFFPGCQSCVWTASQIVQFDAYPYSRHGRHKFRRYPIPNQFVFLV